jgi:eukaryotic-like serine/threonine-protein kinase
MADVPSTDELMGTSRFTAWCRIGSGGMGVVYRAYDRERQEYVAVKTLHQLDAKGIYRLKQEFRVLADLTHPNLVSLHELFSEAGQWFFTMEFVEGCDLHTYVRSGSFSQVWTADAEGPTDSVNGRYGGSAAPSTIVSEIASIDRGERTPGPSDWSGEEKRQGPEACLSHEQLRRLNSAFVQLAEGLSALHQAGRVHRDIKPSNVLVTAQHRVVLLDFGLATAYFRGESSLSTEQHFAGTIPYMSPEQAAGSPPSPATDWYSVGVMLYQLLTGRLPFLGRPLQMLLDKQEFEPPPPRQLVADVPENLNSLCVDILRRKPDLRPSGNEVLRRLGSAPSGPQAPSTTVSSQAEPLFVGRAHYLDELHDAFSTMQRGRTVIVYVQGQSGVGKTALVRRFLHELQGSGQTVVLTGRCYERESVPYKALDSLVDALSHYLVRLPREKVEPLMPRDVLPMARVFPVLRRVESVTETRRGGTEVVDKQELRERGFAALRELLARLGDRKPLVLFIDDLQWGDLDSAALLNDLLSPPDPPILLLIACYRSEDRASSPVLRGILDLPTAGGQAVDVRQIAVDPMDDDEARQLAVSLLGKTIQPLNPSAKQSHGSRAEIPILWTPWCGINEQACDPFRRFRDGPSDQSGRGALGAGRAIVARRRVACWRWSRWRDIRCARSTRSRRRTCPAKAVEALPCCAPPTWSAPRAAEPGDAIETYHDRIRETVVKHIPRESLLQHHRRLANVLEASERPSPPSSRRTSRARRSSSGRPDITWWRLPKPRRRWPSTGPPTLYASAIDFSPDAGDQLRDLRGKLADALADAGRGPQAAREYLAAAEGVNAAEALEMRRRAAMQFLISGHIDDGLAALRTVLAAVGMRLPKSPRRALWSLTLRRLYIEVRGLRFHIRDPSQVSAKELTRIDICWSVAAGLSVVDNVLAADFQARHMLLALRAGDPYRIFRALALEIDLRCFVRKSRRAPHETARRKDRRIGQ